jgi:hypothetical protein
MLLTHVETPHCMESARSRKLWNRSVTGLSAWNAAEGAKPPAEAGGIKFLSAVRN